LIDTGHAMTEAPLSADPRVADLLKAGEVRVALYVPQYTRDPVTGELGGWCVDIVHALGTRLGIKGVPVEHPNPANALTSIASGSCDAGIIGIEADRATKIDYAPPLVEADYTLLAPAGSPYQSIADADRPGVRIAAVRHHASTIALHKIIKHASFAYADMPEPTFQILQRGEADLFASLHEVLRHYVARLPGSRVWEGRYGFNSLGFAVPKGQAARLAFLSEFAEHAKASGIIQKSLDHSGWRGIRVAPPAR
jgi:polar amino acid transport system substrate-binding protein